MAKAAPKTPAKTAPRKAPAGAKSSHGFKFDKNLIIPAATQRSSENSDKLKALLVGESFLIEVAVATNIKPDEIAAVRAQENKKAAGRLANAIRRIKKSNNNLAFAVRTVSDDTLGHGVRVWRTA